MEQENLQEESTNVNSATKNNLAVPAAIVIAPNGKKFEISGAQPYASVKSVIDIALQEK